MVVGRRLLVWGVLAALLPAGSLLAQADERLGQWKLPAGLTPLPTSLRVLDGGKLALLAARSKRSDSPDEYFLIDIERSSAKRLPDVVGGPSGDAAIDSAEPSSDGLNLAIVSSDSSGVSRIHSLRLTDGEARLIYSSQERLDVRWVGSLIAVSSVARDKSFRVVQIIDASGAPVKSLNTRGLAAAASDGGKVMVLAADPADGMRPSALIDFDMRRMHLLAMSYSEQKLMDLGPIMEVTRRPVVSPSGRYVVFRKEVGPASNAPAPTLPVPDIKLVSCDLTTGRSEKVDDAGTPLGVNDAGLAAVFADSQASAGEVRVLDPSGRVHCAVSGVLAGSLQGLQLYTLTQESGQFHLFRRTLDDAGSAALAESNKP